jgi:hypothetical protein
VQSNFNFACRFARTRKNFLESRGVSFPDSFECAVQGLVACAGLEAICSQFTFNRKLFPALIKFLPNRKVRFACPERPLIPLVCNAVSKEPKLPSFIATAAGDLPIKLATKITEGLVAFVFEKGILQYKLNATSSWSRVQLSVMTGVVR